MSAGREFWIVAVGAGASDKDALLNELRGSPYLGATQRDAMDIGPWRFDVPDGDRALMFGSFDNLIRLTDDLQKCDSQVDSIVHRLERQYLDIDPQADFKIKIMRMEKPLMDYLSSWQWDEAKFPKTRSISDNMTLLMGVVNRLDEEARNKLAQYNESKTQRSNIMSKEGGNLLNRDLVDILTPDVVDMSGTSDNDFIYTEHITTVVVIVPRGGEAEFVKSYETLQENVVPMSAKQFANLTDKDGNTLWRVLVFKRDAESFKKQCRERRYVPRDFEYSEEAYQQLKLQREQIDESVAKQHEMAKGLYSVAWSDVMIAWMHVKAMRIFVESVLRFGMPPRFASFLLSPKPGQASQARRALADILGKYASSTPAGDKAAEAQDEGEEYYPYVSMSFQPFAVPRA